MEFYDFPETVGNVIPSDQKKPGNPGMVGYSSDDHQQVEE